VALRLRLARIAILLLVLFLRLATAGAIAQNSAAIHPASPQSDVTLFLDVIVNGHSIGKVGEFTLRGGKLMAKPAELHELGFRVPVAIVPLAGGLIDLSALPGITFLFDQKAQQLHVTASDAALVSQVLGAEGSQGILNRSQIESGTGLTVNYDALATFISGGAGGTGSVEMRIFSPWGILSSQWLTYAGNSSASSGGANAIRLDTAYTFADVNSLRRYSLGDFITDGLAWTRPVHMEGVQIRSDFSMRPDLVTFPRPTLTGSAAVPTTVQVLADGNLVFSSQVEPGPFAIPQLPVISGGGTISMTMTNALGQQVQVKQPFYSSSAMLAPGLQTFATQFGLVRRSWGVVSNDYGKPAGSAIYRRGLTSALTVEGAAEGAPGVTMAGAGIEAQNQHLGTMNLSIAASNGGGHLGGQYNLGVQRIGRLFSLGGAALLADRYYRDIAAVNATGVLRKQLSLFTSFSFRRYGSVGLAYAGVDQDAPPVATVPNTALPEHSRVFTTNYSRQFRHFSFYAEDYRQIGQGSSGSNGFETGITITFRRRSSADLSGTSEGAIQFQAEQSAAIIGDWGYQAFASLDGTDHEFVEGIYKSPVGLFTAGIDRNAGATTVRLESQGALSWVDGKIFPSNTIYDSFAIVDSNPVQHVRVLQENRDIGDTGASGRLLVPDMRAFEVNHLALDPSNLPEDVTLRDSTREIRPQDRSGVVVHFPMRFSHGALLKLVDADGAPIPLGSTAKLLATGVTVPVGYDGDAYVEDLSKRNELRVERKDGRRCTVIFDYHPEPGMIPSIGPLRCQEAKP
jgi:outer membrane usher protein